VGVWVCGCVGMGVYWLEVRGKVLREAEIRAVGAEASCFMCMCVCGVDEYTIDIL
jgi:hypothetical protein